MKQFIAKFESQIQGTLSGFDRVVFRGSLRRLTHPPSLYAMLWGPMETRAVLTVVSASMSGSTALRRRQGRRCSKKSPAGTEGAGLRR